MPGKVVISLLNTYRFVPRNQSIPANYNNLPYKDTLFAQTRKPWNIDTKYLQKVQTADWMRLQVWTGYDTSPATPEVAKMYLRLYTCRGVEIGTPLEIPRLPVVGFPDSDGDLLYVNGIALKTYWAERLIIAGVDEGEFHFILEVPFTDTDAEEPGIDYFVSEPLYVKAVHPKTMQVEVSSSVNRDNMIFQSPVFWKTTFRVEGYVLNNTPQVDRVVFKDQGSNSKQLSAVVYNKPVLSIGYNRPVPYWCIEKANHFLACNNIYIDTVGYTTVEGSQITPEQPDNNFPFFQGNMDLGEKDNNQNAEFAGRGIKLITGVSDRYPFFMLDFRAGIDSVNTAFYAAYNIRISDDEGLSAWMADINAAFLVNGLESTVSVIDGDLVFLPAIGDLVNFALLNVLFGRLGIVTTTVGAAETISLTITISGIVPTYGAVCKPDNTTGAVIYTTPIVPNTVSYVAGAAGNYTFELFHDQENLNGLSIDSLKTSDIDDFGIDDNLPPRLESFVLKNSTRITAFDAYSKLANCRGYLKTLQISNNSALDEITLYTLTSFPAAPGWSALNTIAFSFNSIPVSGIDSIYNQIKDAHLSGQWFVFNGAIVTNNQSPTAVPTVTSADARHILGPITSGGTYNWTIIATP